MVDSGTIPPASSNLRILLCSDMHEDWENLDKLCASEQAGSFDFVFVSGDQACGLNSVEESQSRELNDKMEASNRRIVETLGNLHKAGGKVIYIPGNHDAEILMQPEIMPPIN